MENNSYKASILTGAEQIEISSLAKPDLEPGQVLVRVKYANLCPTDLKKFYKLDEKSKQALSNQSPVVLGHEASGIVENVGSNVTKVQPGQKVAIDPMITCGECVYCQSGDFPMCQNLRGIGASAGSVTDSIQILKEQGIGGCFAEYVKVPAENLFPIPETLSLDAAALMEPLADVVHSIEAGNPREHETAVVFGLGAMGLMHIRLLSHLGVREVIGVEPIEPRRKMAETFGATRTIDPDQEDPVAELNKLRSGTGPDLIFVCTGGDAQKLTTKQALQSIRKGGRILLYASATRPADIPVDINHIHYGMINFTGTVGFYPHHGEKALELLNEGVVDVNAIRTPSYGLEDILEAFTVYGEPDVVKVGIDID